MLSDLLGLNETQAVEESEQYAMEATTQHSETTTTHGIKAKWVRAGSIAKSIAKHATENVENVTKNVENVTKKLRMPPRMLRPTHTSNAANPRTNWVCHTEC